MSIENMYCNESRKSMSPQLLFEVSLFSFHFVAALQYLDCFCNEHLVKETASLCAKLPLKPAFCYCVVVFEMTSLCLF